MKIDNGDIVEVAACINANLWLNDMWNYIGLPGVVKQITRAKKQTAVRVQFQDYKQYWFSPAELEVLKHVEK